LYRPQITQISQIQKRKDSHEKAQKTQKKSLTQDRLNKNSLLVLISFCAFCAFLWLSLVLCKLRNLRMTGYLLARNCFAACSSGRWPSDRSARAINFA
jgi:K+-sensing histidine kinase KdpD